MSIEDLQDEHQDDINDEQLDTPEPDDDELPDDNTDEPLDDDEPKPKEDDPADELGFSFDDDGESEGDPYAGQPAPEWVKQVRKENRELKRQLKQYEQQQPKQGLREMPTIEGHDYDSEAYTQDLQKWLAEKAQHDEQVRAEQTKIQQYQQRYKSSVDNLRAKASDYDDVENTITDTLPAVKQEMLVLMCDDPAKMIYALGKSPNKLTELMQLDDVQFAKQIVLLEEKMKQTKSRNPNKPKPKTHDLQGNAGGGDSKLAKLEAEAERTGDRSKVVAYKRSLHNKS